MIADSVKGCSLGDVPDGAPRWFTRIVSDEQADGALFGALRPRVEDVLFVGDAAGCSAYVEHHPAGWALCVQDESVLPAELAAFADRVIVLQTSRNAGFVATAASCKLIDVSEWLARMQRSLLEGGSYQELVDASEHMLGNALTVSDSGFRIVARTRELLPTNPLIRESIANGMFDKKALDTFRKNERPQRWSTRTGTHLLEVSETGPVVECIFRIEGIYSAHLVMHCEWRPLSDGLLDELSLLADCIELHLKHELSAGRLFDQGPARTLVDLIEGVPVSHRKLNAWLRTSGLACDGFFELAVVDYGYRDEERQLAVYAGLRLLELFPDAVVALKENCAVMVRKCFARGDAATHDTVLDTYARSYYGRVGLSDRFERIEDARFAYRQAVIALSMAASDGRGVTAMPNRLWREGADAAEDTRLFCFRDYLVLYLLVAEQQDEELVSYCVGRGVPMRILEADRRAGTQDCELLFVYLVCERRSSLAAERLHLHRNTLLYRIRRIEQEYGIDLKRWQVRERLLAEYQIMCFGG